MILLLTHAMAGYDDRLLYCVFFDQQKCKKKCTSVAWVRLLNWTAPTVFLGCDIALLIVV